MFIPSLTWITGQEVGREITLVQNEFISDVASFTTDVQTYLLQGFVSFAGAETRNIATQLVLQQCCKKEVAHFLLPLFTVPIDLWPLASPFNITQFHFIIF